MAMSKEWLRPLPLTSAGLPPLQKGEVTYIQKHKVKVDALDGAFSALWVTSHHIIFYDAALHQPQAFFGDLSSIAHIELKSVNFFSRSVRPLIIALSSDLVNSPSSFRIDFSSTHDSEEVEMKLKQSMERKAWVVKTTPNRLERPVGIEGLRRRRELEQRRSGKVATDAFTDLKALMDQAQEVVSIMERYQAQLKSVDVNQTNQTRKNRGDAEALGNGGEKKELHNIFENIGISSPVTKSSAGSDYHQQLARELADFLKSGRHLERGEGMITLPDLYCVFNRARGLALISPDDLFEASSLLDGLELGMALRQFESGVLVVQADTHADTTMSNRILEMIKEHTALTIFKLSILMDIPVTLAREHLNSAEQMGKIARDEDPNGELMFYENLF